MSTVCFDKSYFTIIVVLALGIVLYAYYMLKQENRNLKSSLQVSTDNKINTLNNHISTFNTPINTPINTPTFSEAVIPISPSPVISQPSLGQAIRDYDRRNISDPLTPPFKRDDYQIPSNVMRPDLYGVYSRGAPGVFMKHGYVKTDDVGADYKILTLMGRQKYQGSTQYEYYVISTNRDDTIKFYIDGTKRELYDGDTVKVKQLGNVVYTVYIDKDLQLEYNPLF